VISITKTCDADYSATHSTELILAWVAVDEWKFAMRLQSWQLGCPLERPLQAIQGAPAESCLSGRPANYI
jgi:hypothetical protein